MKGSYKSDYDLFMEQGHRFIIKSYTELLKPLNCHAKSVGLGDKIAPIKVVTWNRRFKNSKKRKTTKTFLEI